MLTKLRKLLRGLFPRRAAAPRNKPKQRSEDRAPPRQQAGADLLLRARVNLDNEEELNVVLLDAEANLYLQIEQRIEAERFDPLKRGLCLSVCG